MSPSEIPNHCDTGIYLLGAGGHALVVADAVLAGGRSITGFMDDAEDPALKNLRLSDNQTPARLSGLEGLDAKSLAGKPWLIGLGDLGLRRALIDRLYAAEEDLTSVVHPRTIVSEHAVVAGGVFVGPGAIVNARARLLDHAIVNSGAIVEHDCLIAENAHIAPGAVLGGTVKVGNDTLVGLGARVLPGVTIGSGCTVGAGAVVLADVADGVTVIGCPAVNR
ncbi:MAG: acetyltransferase [Phycisphaera sp.]|nr:MAG: acetyltransferase [Phycisphaera sp.]